ncbi:GATA transcription factor 26 isoform X2 [Salvia miltiorrhiza]|uniref:GATA transcription factor 26 isoform X2 n=1 Tax=Salvia miltiorrhiza TaxID=226208 RepID=UPI0025ACBB85|nr:GATA transcription factor 26 isoform X2 [Salvia miltiorrhiza]
MGKHGPCYHCGVTSTPLWRNGPPEKPVLCNACGSRWRTKGTLANYTPLHARAEPDELEDLRFSRVKTISIKNKEPKVLKRKLNSEVAEFGDGPPENYQGLHKVYDEDTSNRSSSGSAISNSEKYAQYGIADTSDLTSPAQPSAWDSIVPSRKRTCVARPKPSPVEVLTKDLYTLWYEQQSSCLSGSSEEDLLLESDKPMVSVEIGHGSVLIRHPSSVFREEESEASSLSVDNKQYTLTSRDMSFHGPIEDTGAYSSSKVNEKLKKNTYPGVVQEQTRRDKDQVVKLPILAHHNSPLCYIDLRDIVNFELFSSHLTNDEQQQLMNLLPSVDTSDAPYSLKSMFDSTEFNLNLSSFQKLIADGVFDNSFGGVNTEDCRILKKLVLCDLAKSKWVEQHAAFKDLKCKNTIKSEVVGGYNGFEIVNVAHLKRSREGQHPKNTGSKVMMKSPRRILMKSSYGKKEVLDRDDSFMSAKSLFSIQNDNGSSVLDTSHFEGENSDQDLLLDVPSNGSFPQAELLPSSSFGAMASTSSSSVYPNLVHP